MKPTPCFASLALWRTRVRQDRWSRRVTNRGARSPSILQVLYSPHSKGLDILPAISDACKMSKLALQPASRTVQTALPCRTGSPDNVGRGFIYEKTALPSSGRTAFSHIFDFLRKERLGTPSLPGKAGLLQPEGQNRVKRFEHTVHPVLQPCPATPSGIDAGRGQKNRRVNTP